ncbi:MAG TPA: carbohydrate binding domain-containing protein [Candidatus Saccharimonadales bacterium]|nr:carbohydrate binding domain-containing protein [Candidatus Saccharimonadales bacterium]
MNDEPANQPLPTEPADEHSLQSDPSVVGGASLDPIPLGGEGTVTQAELPKPPRHVSWRRILAVTVLVVGVAVGIFLALNVKAKTSQKGTVADAGTRVKPQSIALPALSQQLAAAISQTTNTLTVNGQVVVSNSLVLQPTSQPSSPVKGQLYYDQNANDVALFNGSQFVYLQGTTIIQNITNVGGNSSVTNINGGGGNVTANGTAGVIAMFTGADSLAGSLLNQSGTTVNVATSGAGSVNIGSNANATNTVNIDAGSGAAGIQIGNSASNHNIQIGSGAGVQNATFGSGSSGSSTTIQGGTGNLAAQTGSSTGVTGSISIKTGDSSTTASGNINIDTGVGVVDGLVIEHKTFEGGLDNMNAWFGNTVAQSSAQAHTGSFSLAETGNAANWGIIETLPGVSVSAGHQYLFSLWVRAATTPRTIQAKIIWNGTSSSVTLSPVTDSTTGWTEMTGLGTAPGGAVSAYWESQSIGAVGEVHYYDDMTVTDLSSSSAASLISIGSANAKIVTIGNINQIGATTINGGSGITLNSGAGDITANGGVINVTGSAASTIATSAGSLTVTSASSASWGIATASAGVGGDLTLHGGNGGTDAVNNGGNVIIQGGRPNGAGQPGSVIVRPLIDSATAFQLQNSTATPFFTADTSGMTITIVGTTSTFAKLVLNNAHFGSTQTTAPTIGTPANCGTTPTAAVTAASTDVAGSFTITTGTGGTSSTCDTVITFNKAYGAAPKSIVVVGKTDAASVARQVYVASSNATTFTVSFATSAAGANSTTYSFNYWIVE